MYIKHSSSTILNNHAMFKIIFYLKKKNKLLLKDQYNNIISIL